MCEDEEKLLTTSQAAKFLEVSDSSIKRWIDSGKLKARRTAGGHRRILLSQVREFRATFYPGIGENEPARTKKVNWSTPEAATKFFKECMIDGDPFSMEKAIRSKSDLIPAEIFDRYLYPAFQSVRSECEYPSSDCSVLSRSGEATRKCVTYLHRSNFGKRNVSILFADIGGPLDGLLTYLAEASVWGHIKPIQLGIGVPVPAVIEAARTDKPDFLMVSGQGEQVEFGFQKIIQAIKAFETPPKIISLDYCNFSKYADQSFKTFTELHSFSTELEKKSINRTA